MHDDISNLTSYFDVDKHTIFRHFFKTTESPSYNAKNKEASKNKPNNTPVITNTTNLHIPPKNKYIQNTDNNESQNSTPIITNKQTKTLHPPSTTYKNSTIPHIEVPSSGSENEDDEIILNSSEEKFSYDSESIHSNTNTTTSEKNESSVPPTQQIHNSSDCSENSYDTSQSTPTKITTKKLFSFSSPFTPHTSNDERDPFDQLLSDINKEKMKDNLNTKKNELSTSDKTHTQNTNNLSKKSKTKKHTHNTSSSITPKHTKKSKNSTTLNLITPKTSLKGTKTSKSSSTHPEPSTLTNKKTKIPKNNTITLDNLPTIPRKKRTNTHIYNTPIDIDDSDLSTISQTSTTNQQPSPKTHIDDKTNTIYEIKNQLRNTIPFLSYKLFHLHNSENEESQADAAVMAFWESNNIGKTTTEVNLSLEQERHLKRETISNLITTTCKTEIQKTLKNHIQIKTTRRITNT